MTNYTNYSDRERLSFLSKETQPEQVKKSRLLSLVDNIFQYIIATLGKGQELKVWQSTDRFGNTYWYGYDPVTDKTVSRYSEAEMRIWVEQRYYQ